MLTVLREGRELEARLLGEGPLPVALDDKKSVNATVDTAVRRLAFKPAANYPWRAMARPAANMAEAQRQARERLAAQRPRHRPTATPCPSPPNQERTFQLGADSFASERWNR